jgi:hypothetical protein
MGCFNANGFFSKLPLQSGDEMVLIFCADLNRVAPKDALPIYVAERLVPLNAPIYCEYNDYGSVFEDTVVRDANAEFFEKSIGVNCEKLCRMIHDFGGVNLDDLREIKEAHAKEKESEFDKRRIKEAEEYENVLEILFKRFYHIWKNHISLVWIMEHKDVYEKISSIASGPVINDWRDDTDISAVRCKRAFEMAEEYKEFDSHFNLLNEREFISAVEESMFKIMFSTIEEKAREKIHNELKKFREKYGEEHRSFVSSACLADGGGLNDAFPTYAEIVGVKEWEKYSKNFIDFFRFTRIMHALHRVFEESTYASQCVCTSPLSKVSNIINDKAQEICKEYNEMYNED